jgi:hypothetical protein
LKITDKDGNFRYSAIRKINFSNNGDDISIYPNPVSGSKIFIASSGIISRAVLYDAAGRTVKIFELNTRTSVLNLEGISKGSFQLRVFTENSMHTEKIIIQ